MKTHLLIGIKLTLAMLIFFGLLYPLAITGIANFVPGGGEGRKLETEGKVVGFEIIGQAFRSDKYFTSRPSAVNYNAAATGGSNKGPSNPEYLAQVEERINEFLKHNPEVKREDIPVDLVTASGGGLDPHISVTAANIQIPRISETTGLSREVLQSIVTENTEHPLLSVFGPSKVNVLKANIAISESLHK